MTTSRRAPGPVRRACAALALVAPLALASCGSDSPDSTPDPTPSSPASSATTEPTEPTTSDNPAVTPASGLPIGIREVSANGPQGWPRVTKQFRNIGRAVRNPGGNTLVGLYSVPWLNSDESLDILVKAVKLTGNFTGPVQVLDPVIVDGVECYHVQGNYGGGEKADLFGAVHARDQVNFTFSFARDFPQDERQDVIDSVLASVDWK